MLAFALVLACAPSGPAGAPSPLAETSSALPGLDAVPPVFVTVVLHNEEPREDRPDYLRDAEAYHADRRRLVAFVELLAAHGAALNFQSDWNWLLATERHEPWADQQATGGKDVLSWMLYDMGVELDPHAHETMYNYSDVAWIIEDLGHAPGETLGGFVYAPAEEESWTRHAAGEPGWHNPDYTWRPRWLWGAATMGHAEGDETSTGAWRPASAEAFEEHDPNGQLAYIGTCTVTPTGLHGLLADLEAGRAPARGFYTASLADAQDMIDLGWWERTLRELDPYVLDGRVQWRPLSKVAERWEAAGEPPARRACGG